MSNSKIGVAAIVAVLAASAPGAAAAQNAPLDLSSSPSAGMSGRTSISDRVRALNAKVTAELGSRQISPTNAVVIQRELNGIQGQLSADQEKDGGHLTVADHLDLQAQVDKISDEIRKDTLPTH